MPKTILICGSRNYTDREAIENELALYTNDELIIVSGHAQGADSIAEDIAFRRGFTQRIHRAQWDKYGRSAGPIRNSEMLTKNPVDEVWAFSNSITTSKGTQDMIKKARKHNIFTKLIAISL